MREDEIKRGNRENGRKIETLICIIIHGSNQLVNLTGVYSGENAYTDLKDEKKYEATHHGKTRNLNALPPKGSLFILRRLSSFFF